MNSQSSQPSLPPFDELVRMHQQDPASLEQLRTQLLQQAVESAPTQHRPALEQLVVEMNNVRDAAASDAEAAAAAFRLMQRSVRNLGDALHEAMNRVADLQTTLLLKRISIAAANSNRPLFRVERRKASRM